jgi:hypothetical protein
MPSKNKSKTKIKTKAKSKTVSKAATKKRQGLKLPNANRTVDDYDKALREAKGYVSGAAELLEVTPSAVYKAMVRHKRLYELYRQLAEDRRLPALDMSEAKLMEAVCAGKAWAIKYFLNNQGGERGYGRKLALDGKLEAEIRPADPTAAYRDMPPELRRKRITELLKRAEALKGE